MYAAQNERCGCGCGKELQGWEGRYSIGEHVHDLVALGCEEKPDSLWHPDCAFIKTNKSRNGRRSDKGQVAHIKRLIKGPKVSKNPMRSRGFDKTKRKHMDGTVSKRG